MRECGVGRSVPAVGIGLLGVALAFGLTVLTMAVAIGHISGCHLNPAVSVGLVVGGRFPARELPAYIVAQVIGGIVAAALLYVIASGKPGFELASGLASNGYGEHSPGGYSMAAGFVCELVMTAMFVLIILGATDPRAPKGLAPIAIGLALTLIHLISIPVTNTSVNPARSTGTGADRGRVGDPAIVDVLARADPRRGDRRRGLSMVGQGEAGLRQNGFSPADTAGLPSPLRHTPESPPARAPGSLRRPSSTLDDAGSATTG